MMSLRTAAGTKGIAALHLLTGAGLKNVARISLRRADGTKVIFRSLSSGGDAGGTAGISVYPESTYGIGNRSSSSTITSKPVSVSVSGGVPPYTYNWVYVSGDALTITDPTASVTSFSASVVAGGFKSAVFKCTVTDAAGVSADSPDVQVDLENTGSAV